MGKLHFDNDEYHDREARKRQFKSKGLAGDLDTIRTIRDAMEALQLEEAARLDHVFDYIEAAGVKKGESRIINSKLDNKAAFMVDRLEHKPAVLVTTMKVEQ